MASNALSGIGAILKRGDGASAEAFTAVAEVRNITGPNMTRDQIDVTSLDSTSGYREYIGGFRDGGEVTLECNWTRDVYLQFLADFQNDTTSRNWQIVFPDTGATTFDFAAIVTALSNAIPADDKIDMPVTLKVDGPVVPSS
jgi:predicted secreted protein